MSYLSKATHDAVCDGRLAIAALYEKVSSTFVGDLPAALANDSPDGHRAMFATVLAYDLKRYGPENPVTLAQCLAAGSMNCDNYCLFASEIYAALGGAAQLAIVGWRGGAVGNHAQLLYTAGRPILLDPTIGLIAGGVSLDTLARGEPPANDAYKSFFAYNAARSPTMSGFNTRVTTAVTGGRYTASSLLYYFSSTTRYLAWGGKGFPTPAAA